MRDKVTECLVSLCDAMFCFLCCHRQDRETRIKKHDNSTSFPLLILNIYSIDIYKVEVRFSSSIMIRSRNTTMIASATLLPHTTLNLKVRPLR
jgi:hypothetical protein